MRAAMGNREAIQPRNIYRAEETKAWLHNNMHKPIAKTMDRIQLSYRDISTIME